jgi:hypothetical protein
LYVPVGIVLATWAEGHPSVTLDVADLLITNTISSLSTDVLHTIHNENQSSSILKQKLLILEKDISWPVGDIQLFNLYLKGILNRNLLSSVESKQNESEGKREDKLSKLLDSLLSIIAPDDTTLRLMISYWLNRTGKSGSRQERLNDRLMWAEKAQLLFTRALNMSGCAFSVFAKPSSSSCSVSVDSFAALIDFWAPADVDKAIDLLELMLKQGMTPLPNTITGLIRACVSQDRLLDCEQLLMLHLRLSIMNRRAPDNSCCLAALDAFSSPKAQMLVDDTGERATALWDRISEAGGTINSIMVILFDKTFN